MKKRIIRPVTVSVISALLVVSPFLNIYQYLFYGKTTHWIFIRHSTDVQSLTGFALILLAVFSGVGVYRISRWGWYLFFGFACFISCFSIYRIFQVRDNFAYLISVLCIVFMMTAVYLLSKNIRLPYLSDEFRGWRIKKRLPLALPVKIAGDENFSRSLETRTIDFSEFGALVKLHKKDGDYTLGQKIYLELTLSPRETIHTLCKVVQLRDAEGDFIFAGLKFIRTGKTQKKIIKTFIDSRYSTRLAVALPLDIKDSSSTTFSGKTHNLSFQGCYITLPEMSLQQGDEVTCRLLPDQGPLKKPVVFKGMVTWTNPGALFDKPAGFGVNITGFSRGRLSFYLFLLFTMRGAAKTR